ncbi:alpha/beta fold hydrolase [Prochlorococcus sp. MIT 1307]|uniref:alpha/beta fold hydrolase n=1 Tax=Prochlorococcus sp. MIT 1307 TaxID=3096219 RepID=UPI002A74D633|nr:alpha/beta fold hydrolase [Prochlorococcus sp. MIT 1307]
MSNISQDGSQWGELNNWYWKGIRCHWRVLGKTNKRPVLLLHGFGASSAHWRHNASAFVDAGFCVYGLDLIGFGDSEQPSKKIIPKLDNQLWAEQVAAFLEQVVHTKKYGKAVLIGNSLGSLTALTTLAYRPELVSALVAAPLPDPTLVEPIIYAKSEWLEKLRKNLIKVFFKLLPLEILVPFVSRTVILKIGLQAAYQRSIKSDKELFRLIAKPAKRKTAARALRAMCIGMATRPKETTAPVLLHRLASKREHSPILLLWGKQDKLVPLKIGQQLIKKHPWINLVVLDKTGHCPHDESPNLFNQNVLNWLGTIVENNQQEA